MGWRREWKYQEDSIGKNIDGWNNRKGIEWNGWRDLKSITQMDSKTLIKSLSYHCVVIGIASVTGFRRFFHCQFIKFPSGCSVAKTKVSQRMLSPFRHRLIVPMPNRTPKWIKMLSLISLLLCCIFVYILFRFSWLDSISKL